MPRLASSCRRDDRQRFLSETLRSVLPRRVVDLEVVVVDDRSAEGQVDAVDRLA